MGVNIQQGLTSSGGIIVDSQQPTSDVNAVVSTGFNGCRLVEVWFAFTHNSASSLTYTLQGRVSGGTWRDIASFASAADATSSIGGYLNIANFNVATEKIASFIARSFGSVLDDSSATTVLTAGAATVTMSYLAWNEIWDEVQIISSSGNSIEGDTADQRGRWYVKGIV